MFNWILHRVLVAQKMLRHFFKKAPQAHFNSIENEQFELSAQREVYEKLKSVSPSMCLAKWLQVSLHLHTGLTQSCHHVKAHKIPQRNLDSDPSALHNTPFKMKTRKQMLKGVRPSECEYCWAFEDQGRLSDRLFKSADPWAAPHFDEVLEKGAQHSILPRSVEVSFENTCNLKCMYCGPQFSSTWMDEAKRFGAYPTADQHGSLKWQIPYMESEQNPYVKAFWHWWPDLSKQLKVFRITGGEPLLSQQTWKVFEKLRETPQPKLHFAINSNLSMSRQLVKKLIQNLNQIEGKVERFTLFTSVDTVGKQAEYIRFGMNFENYLQNVDDVLTEVQWPIEVSYMVTVNALSIEGLAKLLKIIHEQRKKHSRHKILFDAPVLNNPTHMSVKILPKEFVRYIDEALDLMKSLKTDAHGFQDWEIQKVDRIRTLMLNDSYTGVELSLRRQDFFKMYQEYDKRRGTQFLNTFPAYAEFFSHCQNISG